MPREKPLLQIRLHGQFKPGRIPIPLLLKVCGEAQTVVNRQAEALEGRRTLRRGPATASVSRDCTLELFGLKKGSTSLSFARASGQLPLDQTRTSGFEAVSAVGDALNMVSGKRNGSVVPDAGVLDTLNKLGEVFDKGVTRIEWIVPRHNGNKRVAAEYAPALRPRIAARIQPRTPSVNTTVEGTLELAGGKCRISPAVGSPFVCGFEQEKAEEVHNAMHKPVKVSVDPKTRKIETIEVQDIPHGEDSFFSAKTIGQLIAEQGVHPIEDLTELSGALPDEDLDEMVAWIYRDRQA
jgi:hypothetical protein